MRRVLIRGDYGAKAIQRARELARDLPSPSGDDLTALRWLYEWRPLGGPVTGAPFRAPHWTVSAAGLVGVGPTFGSGYPGEVTLAHAGCLLLDELPEFRASTLDALGCVLRRGAVSVRRAHVPLQRERVEGWSFDFDYPARPAMLVVTARNCPGVWETCGRGCTCERDRPEALARWGERLRERLGLLGPSSDRLYDARAWEELSL